MATKEELEKLTIPALKALCKERNITGVSKAKKDVLVARLLGGPSADVSVTSVNASAGGADKPTKKVSAKPKKKNIELQAGREVEHVINDDATAQEVDPTGPVSESAAKAGASEAVAPIASTTAPAPMSIPPTTATAVSAPAHAVANAASPIAATPKTSKATFPPKASAARDRKRAATAGAPPRPAAGIKRVKLAPKAAQPAATPTTTGEEPPAFEKDDQQDAPPSKSPPPVTTHKVKPRAPPAKPVATGFKPLAKVVKPAARASDETNHAQPVHAQPSTPADMLDELSRSWLARMCRYVQHAIARPGSSSSTASTTNRLHLLFSPTFLASPALSSAQLRIATRFVTARVHTSFQLEQYEDVLRPLVVTAVEPALDQHRPLATGTTSPQHIELWEVTTRGKQVVPAGETKGPRRISSSSTHAELRGVSVSYLVIGTTGDVIATRREVQPRTSVGGGSGGGSVASSRILLQSQASTSSVVCISSDAPFAVRWLGQGGGGVGGAAKGDAAWKKGLRHDWARYLTSPGEVAPLIRAVKTKESEQYPSGIARAWRERAAKKGMHEEVDVAERYVLCNAALNSVSGTYMSAAQMDAERLGQAMPDVGPKKPSVAFYLPESHHVEAVSFSTLLAGRSQPLHPALAAVTRPASTDLILRETGQVVGCEEGDGVSELWMTLLGCTARGLPLGEEDAEEAARCFWEGHKEK